MIPAVLAAVAIGGAIFCLATVIFGRRDERVLAARYAEIAGTTVEVTPTGSSYRRDTRLERRISGNVIGAWLKRDLRRSGLPWHLRDYVGLILVSALVGIILGAFARGPIGMLIGSLTGLIPLWLVHRSASRRAARLNTQIVDLVELLASSLRAGFTFVQSIEIAAREQSEPIAAELRQLVQETSLGVSTDEALERLVQRTGDGDLELVITAVLVQRRVGGNLGEVLGNISAMIRERIRVRGQIKALTAQARMSSWVIGLLPVVVAIAMTMMQHDYLAPLVTQAIGKLALGAGVLMEIVGFLIIRRVGSVDF